MSNSIFSFVSFASGLQYLSIHSWNITLREIAEADPTYERFCGDPRLEERVKIEALYDEFITAQRQEVEAARKEHSLAIPEDVDYEE